MPRPGSSPALWIRALLLMSAGGYAGAAAAHAPSRVGSEAPSVSWKECLKQPRGWYGTPEAVRMADNVLLFQREHGGWPKGIDMAAPLGGKDRAKVLAEKRNDDSTIDNGATHTQLAFLARVYDASGQARFREGFCRGFDYLLKAQYPNGGWPQYYPRMSGYRRLITYNDGAMVRVLSVLRDVARAAAPYGWVDPERRGQAAEAVRRGVECILRTQVVVDGRPTAWCAQHDEKTLAPAKARSYELPSLSGSESVEIARFLMRLDHPDPRVVAAIQGAVTWFQRARISGIRCEQRRVPALPGGRDVVVVEDASAPPLWARFYEIEGNRPFFCGRDGVKKYRLAEIEHERRIGYSWYTDRPRKLLEEDYPAWQKRWVPGQNVLKAGAS